MATSGRDRIKIGDIESPFSEAVMVQRRPVFTAISTDELSILRDIVTTTANGAVTSTESEFRVNAPASGDSATLGTAIRGRYVPGYAAEGGLGARLGTRSTGATVKWGLYDDDDGLSFLLDDDGMHFQIERNNSTTLDVDLADANVDALDGTGPSQIDVSDFGGIEAYLQQGHVFQIRFTWYGYGMIEWAVVDQALSTASATEGEQRVWALHRERVRDNTTVEDPNLPIRYTCTDGADVYVGGRQYSILGQLSAEERNLGDYRYQQSITAANILAGGTPLDSDWVPLIAIRRRSDVEWAKAVAVVTDDLEVVSDQKIVVQEFIGPTVDDGSWVSVQYTNGSSAVEVNRTATAMTFPSGTFPDQTIALDPLIVVGGGGSKETRTQTSTKRTNLPQGQQLILAAFVPGNTDATVDSVLDWLEIR